MGPTFFCRKKIIFFSSLFTMDDNLPRKLAPIGVLLISILLYSGLGGGGFVSTLLVAVLLLIAGVSFVNTQQGHKLSDELKKEREARRLAAKKLQGGKPPQSVASPKVSHKPLKTPTTTTNDETASSSTTTTTTADKPKAKSESVENQETGTNSPASVDDESITLRDDVASDKATDASSHVDDISSNASSDQRAPSPAIAPIPASKQPIPPEDDDTKGTDDNDEDESYTIDPVTASAEPEEGADDELLEWEALQREAEAQAATEAAAQQTQSEADSLDALLADVAGDDDAADETKTADTDNTEKAASFWGHFEEKTAGTSAKEDEAGSEGDGDAVEGEADAGVVLGTAATPLPAKYDSFSSSGVVKKGHIDIDSEDEADEQLADTVISGSSRYDIGFADTKGIRSTMEDEMVVYGTFRDVPEEDYVAVFDGHGGSEASAGAAEELHELLATHLDEPEFEGRPGAALGRAFESCQRVIEQAEPTIQSGTTAVVAYFQKDQGWVANAGDSGAVLCKKTGSDAGAVEAKRVTTDHKPSLPAEEARIKAAGGFVTRTQTKRGEVSRVCAILGVARALGDTFLQPMVTCVPDVFEVTLDEYDVLILACDGLWDVVTDREAAIVALSVADAGDAARKLRDFAFARGSDDNISVLVVRLKPAL